MASILGPVRHPRVNTPRCCFKEGTSDHGGSPEIQKRARRRIAVLVANLTAGAAPNTYMDGSTVKCPFRTLRTKAHLNSVGTQLNSVELG